MENKWQRLSQDDVFTNTTLKTLPCILVGTRPYLQIPRFAASERAFSQRNSLLFSFVINNNYNNKTFSSSGSKHGRSAEKRRSKTKERIAANKAGMRQRNKAVNKNGCRWAKKQRQQEKSNRFNGKSQTRLISVNHAYNFGQDTKTGAAKWNRGSDFSFSP